jgi:hypothetical protein
MKSKYSPNEILVKKVKHDYTGLPKLHFGGKNIKKLEKIVKLRKADTRRIDELDKLDSLNQNYNKKVNMDKSKRVIFYITF